MSIHISIIFRSEPDTVALIKFNSNWQGCSTIICSGSIYLSNKVSVYNYLRCYSCIFIRINNPWKIVKPMFWSRKNAIRITWTMVYFNCVKNNCSMCSNVVFVLRKSGKSCTSSWNKLHDHINFKVWICLFLCYFNSGCIRGNTMSCVALLYLIWRQVIMICKVKRYTETIVSLGSVYTKTKWYKWYKIKFWLNDSWHQ